jgi:hypothetical protein
MKTETPTADKRMKVHSESRRCWREKGGDCPEYVPFSLLSEEMAQRNHSQSLDRLNERGGMGVLEILDNIHGRRLSRFGETIEHLNELNERISSKLETPAQQIAYRTWRKLVNQNWTNVAGEIESALHEYAALIEKHTPPVGVETKN